MSPKTFESALTHYQIVSLIFINFLKDPGLVRYFIPFLKNADIEDAHNFHYGPNSKWAQFKGSDFIYTDLFTHKKRSYSYLDHIRYFAKGLLQKKPPFSVVLNSQVSRAPRHIPLTVNESIFAVNQMMDKTSLNGEIFRKHYSFRTISETLALFQYETTLLPTQLLFKLNVLTQVPHLVIEVPKKWSYRIYDPMDKNITGFFISSVY